MFSEEIHALNCFHYKSRCGKKVPRTVQVYKERSHCFSSGFGLAGSRHIVSDCVNLRLLRKRKKKKKPNTVILSTFSKLPPM